MNCIGGLSNNELYRSVVKQFISKACPTYLFGGLSNEIISESDQCVFENKKKIFCFENSVFHTWQMHV